MRLPQLFKRAKAGKVIGRHLRVSLPELGVENVRAKVDTGAYSGAYHAEDIREVAAKGGKVNLRFKLSNGKTVTVPEFHTRKVMSSSGHISERYAINTLIEIQGETYPIILTLTDRSSLRRPMLIGRSFLRTHGFLVDVTKINK